MANFQTGLGTEIIVRDDFLGNLLPFTFVCICVHDHVFDFSETSQVRF